MTDEIRALIDDMFETMYAAPGIGLAAIQVGVPKRVLVIDLQEPEEEEGEPVREPARLHQSRDRADLRHAADLQ